MRMIPDSLFSILREERKFWGCETFFGIYGTWIIEAVRGGRHVGQFFMELWEMEGIYYKDFSFLQRADLKV